MDSFDGRPGAKPTGSGTNGGKDNVDRNGRRSRHVPSQGSISPIKAERLLRESGAVLTSSNRNCVYVHGKREGAKHWVVKALLLKILRDMGRIAGTEVEVVGGVVDVLDLDSFVGYEVESSLDRTAAERKARKLWQLHDVVFVDARKVPDDIEEAERYLRGIVF